MGSMFNDTIWSNVPPGAYVDAASLKGCLQSYNKKKECTAYEAAACFTENTDVGRIAGVLAPSRHILLLCP